MINRSTTRFNEVFGHFYDIDLNGITVKERYDLLTNTTVQVITFSMILI